MSTPCGWCQHFERGRFQDGNHFFLFTRVWSTAFSSSEILWDQDYRYVKVLTKNTISRSGAGGGIFSRVAVERKIWMIYKIRLKSFQLRSLSASLSEAWGRSLVMSSCWRDRPLRSCPFHRSNVNTCCILERNRDLKQITTATASRTWKNKRSNWQNSSARAFKTLYIS